MVVIQMTIANIASPIKFYSFSMTISGHIDVCVCKIMNSFNRVIYLID